MKGMQLETSLLILHVQKCLKECNVCLKEMHQPVKQASVRLSI
jgi:hypothetical protein